VPEIITRAEAKARGLKRYFTGKPCKHGHIAEWAVSNYTCWGCISEKRIPQYLEMNLPSPKQASECRARALREGLSIYYTGKPCLRGHRSGRFVSSKCCVECARIKDRRRNKKRRERQREYQKKYQGSEQSQKYRRDYYRANRQKFIDKAEEWRKHNYEKWKANKRKIHRNGPTKPNGELQWLRKNQAQLRNVKRYLRDLRRAQSESSPPEM
jgi:isocitrate lyase